MEKEPKRGIPARPAKVNAAEDIIERVVSIRYVQDPKNFLFLFFFFKFLRKLEAFRNRSFISFISEISSVQYRGRQKYSERQSLNIARKG